MMNYLYLSKDDLIGHTTSSVIASHDGMNKMFCVVTLPNTISYNVYKRKRPTDSSYTISKSFDSLEEAIDFYNLVPVDTDATTQSQVGGLTQNEVEFVEQQDRF